MADLETYGRAYWRAVWIMSVSWIALTIAAWSALA